MFVRRLVLVISIAFCGLLALAVGVVGAGGGLGPGEYTFTSSSASAFFGAKGSPTPQTSFTVFVNQGLNSFEPQDGGSPTVSSSTMVIFTMFKPDGTGGTGCFLISPSDFNVSRKLQSASLHTQLRVDNQCSGIGKPLGPPQAGVVPAGGKAGGLTALLPINVDLTWSGAGVVSRTTEEFSFTCLDRQEEGQNEFRHSLGGSVAGTIAGVTNLNTLSADVAHQDGQLQIQGNSTPPCFG